MADRAREPHARRRALPAWPVTPAVAVVVAVAVAVAVVAGCSGGSARPAPASASTPVRAPAPVSAPTPAPTPAGASASTPPPAFPASPDTGAVRRVDIPGTVSRFAARPAEVYLPAALRDVPLPALPVLELLHGTPGSPADWVGAGHLQATMDAFAAAHNGLAPIVVVPDINGSERGDTECVRARSGADVETYLTVDVPRWITSHFRTLPAPGGWAIGGLSEGGTCSLMLALRASRRYSTAADLSGLTRPTVGDRDEPAATVRELFGGSRAAFDRHDPVYLLHHHRYPALRAWFECGAADPTLADQRVLVAAARSAGVGVQSRVVAGGHSWTVWAAALRQLLPWMWRRTTVTT